MCPSYNCTAVRNTHNRSKNNMINPDSRHQRIDQIILYCCTVHRYGTADDRMCTRYFASTHEQQTIMFSSVPCERGVCVCVCDSMLKPFTHSKELKLDMHSRLPPSEQRDKWFHRYSCSIVICHWWYQPCMCFEKIRDLTPTKNAVHRTDSQVVYYNSSSARLVYAFFWVMFVFQTKTVHALLIRDSTTKRSASHRQSDNSGTCMVYNIYMYMYVRVFFFCTVCRCQTKPACWWG